MQPKGFTDAVGSTGTVKTIGQGVVLKAPWNFQTEPFISDARRSFAIESQILQFLEPHPRIVRYLGQADNSEGILLGEASHGDLQDYLDKSPTLGRDQRLVLCRQAVEAVVYIHGRGVIHSDLRPGNFLVHASSSECIDLLLSDFGGSVCQQLGLDGMAMPSVPFYHPELGSNVSTALDLFSLGSILYAIITGRWPYRDSPGRPQESKERDQYETMVEEFLRREEFPDVSELPGSHAIRKCWKRQYQSAQDLLHELVTAGF